MTNEERAREAATEIAKADPDWDTHAEIILAALNAATAELEEERRRLRLALRPFAAFADRFGDHGRDDSWVLTRNPTGTGNLTMGDVRAARSALAKKDPSNA